MSKPMLILESNLTGTPRYYATTAYRTSPGVDAEHMQVVVTGQKHDVTDQIEAIVSKRLNERAGDR